MPRALATTAALALAASAALPLLPAGPARAAEAPRAGASVQVTGGGDGWSGPASRARNAIGPMDVAPDGSVLVAAKGLLRLDTSADRLSVVVAPGSTGSSGITDVAAVGSRVVGVHEDKVAWVGADGSVSDVAGLSGVRAVDAGSDGVVWAITRGSVVRVMPDDTVVPVPGATTYGDLTEIAVSPDGQRAYVLDHGTARHGVYEVTADGPGPRVAGTGYRSDSLQAGVSALDASMEAVNGLATDGTTLTVSSHEYARIMTFPIGGVLSQVYSGPCNDLRTRTASTLYVVCGDGDGAVHRLSSTGTDLGRVLGQDPANPWSPDGIRAADAYLDEVRGAAAQPGGGVVLATRNGLVREVGADGLLRTRARLAALTTRGKVAVGPDRTAYVVTDAGAIVKVPVTGSPQTLALDADAADVEVMPDGRLLVADGRGRRLVTAAATGGAVTVLALLPAAPTDIGLDGDGVLVADTGLRRVGPDGTVSTLLHGGQPTHALRGRDGVWTGRLHQPDTWNMVLRDSGALSAMRVDADLAAQAQATGTGDVVTAGPSGVWQVSDAGVAPEVEALDVTAQPGSGRVNLDWSGQPDNVVVRAKRGQQAPTDMWDGQQAQWEKKVFRVDGTLVEPGEEWTFAVFAQGWATLGGSTVVDSWSAAAVVSGSADADTTAPQLTDPPSVYADHTSIWLGYDDPNSWRDPSVDDFDHSVVRMALGTSPPQTPSEGVELQPEYPGSHHSIQVPDPVRGQDYAISVFTVDFRGNAARWSTVVRLDWEAPVIAGGLKVTPSFTTASVDYAPPTDADYEGVLYAVAKGSAVPPVPDGPAVSWRPIGLSGLTMGTDYTVAVWARDRAGNLSAPVTATFRTELDDTPPGPVTNLVATGGSYRVSASWTAPTDADYRSVVVELVDPVTSLVTPCASLTTPTSCTWSRVPGGVQRVVRVRAKDAVGNLSAAAEATATTDPDANGAPAPIALESVTVSPTTPTTVTVRFPRPTIPDLKSLGYAVLTEDQDPKGPITWTIKTLSTSSSTVTGAVTLPEPNQRYQLVLYVWDLNSNRAQTVVPGVVGGADPSARPSLPTSVKATSPADNTLEVSWARSDLSAPVDTWTVTATPADPSMSVVTRTFGGSTTRVWLQDLPGRTQWWVTVAGSNSTGTGSAARFSSSVAVADNTAPPQAGGVTLTPSYTATTLTWAKPIAFDFDRVEVKRFGSTAAETAVVYRGTGTKVALTGLVAGRSYRFEIRSFDHLGNVSLPVVRTIAMPTLSLSVPSAVKYGGTVKATGTLVSGGKALAGRSVGVFAQKVGTTTWTRVATTTTGSTGAYAVVLKPLVNTRYRAGYAGAGTIGGSYSAVRTVTVAPQVSMKASRTSLYLGSTVTLSTVVGPSHAGRSVALQRWSGSSWVTITSRKLSSTSTASASIRPSVRGTNSYRWLLPSHTDHGNGVSATARVSVL